MRFLSTVELVTRAIEAAGIGVLLIGATIATVVFLMDWRRRTFDVAYKQYRQSLAQAILLGLEFLIAADIIQTVAVSPSMRNVAMLATIVLIRTLLSVALQVEVEGRWPWQGSMDRGTQLGVPTG